MQRTPELDALRGIAAVVIVLYHLRFVGLYPGMATAVDLFFVLSGYLITTIILQTRQARNFFQVFYIRRSLRIWPAYYFALAACVAINHLLPPGRREPLEGLGYFLTYTQYIPKYWGGRPPEFSSLFWHSWTLAIEEQFYLLWPILAWRTGRRTLGALTVPFLVVPIVLRGLGIQENLLFSRCDGLALGALLAVLLADRERWERHVRRYRLAFGTIALTASAILAAGWTRGPLVLSWVNLAYFGLVGWVVASAGRPCLKPLRWRLLGRAGIISYGLYLYHPLVFCLVTRLHIACGIHGSQWMDALKVVASFGVAALSWLLLEKPILGLKGRYQYALEPPPTPGGIAGRLLSTRGPHHTNTPAEAPVQA